MFRKKPIFNIKFKYVNNIVILRTGPIIFYITAVLITDIKRPPGAVATHLGCSFYKKKRV